MSTIPPLKVRFLGEQDYIPIWGAMRDFTAQRTADSNDELWVVEHRPVYTLGLNGKSEHLLQDNGIPVIAVDRGGQVTYHGPGQIVVYTLLDLKRKGINIRVLVEQLEQAVIDLLAGYQLQATRKQRAPGVYVEGKKIAALGLRVRHGCCYHGLSMNIDMDLSPFRAINPCGYADLETTQLSDWVTIDDYAEITHRLVGQLIRQLGYTRTQTGTAGIDP